MASRERMDEQVAQLEDRLLRMDRLGAMRLYEESGVAPMAWIESVIVPALENIGRAWETGDVALSQIYMGGRICEEFVKSVSGQDAPVNRASPKIALVSLEDYHLLGKRMVYASVRSAGYELIDYGRMTAEALAERALQDGVEILLISTLMLDSALRVCKVKEGLRSKGRATKLVVGGAPFRFDEQLWRDVGADAMGRNASDVLPLIGQWARGAA